MAEQDVALLKQQVQNRKFDEAQETLVRVKISMINFRALPPATATTPEMMHERQIARDAMEQAVLLSIGLEDCQSFQRHFAQLKPFYVDDARSTLDSLRCTICGLNLLFLLVENRLAEFHSELELLTDEEQHHEAIAYPIRLEQYLMVGSYNQILEAKSTMPNSSFEFFMSLLVDTVRDFIAECTEVAYTSLSMDAARQMMMLDSKADLENFIHDAHDNWVVDGQTIRFKVSANTSKSSDLPSTRIITETLAYATELERIV
mmetsp:Transcript_50458/g.68605  ORF Transcript_50458/g.68605 Transcript_50458/m.68605 type:complete len:261 (-) Transcript_50458:458-1240(-)|eukprot:CAMPEP_0185771772 /NCGR_PEP_ID=MMETSP1174-20130828/65050_1 /TAXON_ID=35687 /ORGANISM="Dictyocha speculum, Strain CCMP1381" /LENGTH=260 /DNA_ID=CAMNT_0028457733 /DNA_START=33 /DNA_END=815 /DNA_ORIENTATION=-